MEIELKLGLSHRMRKDEVTKTLIENDVSFDASYKESDTLTWYGGYSYDIEDKLSKKWKAGFLYDKECWNFTLIFQQGYYPHINKK